MNKIDEAIDRIKILECPTGELENRVAAILEDYGVAAKSEISIDRDDNLESDEAKEYEVKIPGESRPIIVLSKSGLDDYVEKVVDVHSKQ